MPSIPNELAEVQRELDEKRIESSIHDIQHKLSYHLDEKRIESYSILAG